MKDKTKNTYFTGMLIGASIGWYAVAISSCIEDMHPHDVPGLEALIPFFFFTTAGAAAGAGIAVLYYGGKKVHEVYRKIFPINKKNNLEKLIEK